MGEMAEYYSEMGDEEDLLLQEYRQGKISAAEAYELGIVDERGFESAGRGPRSVVCKHCHRADLHWHKTPQGWRTAEPAGNIHDCPAFKKPTGETAMPQIDEIGSYKLEIEQLRKYVKQLEEILQERPADEWQPMETAPRDGSPILGWCVHNADPIVEDKETGRLTLYGAHVEGLKNVEDGAHVLVWGGGWDDRSYEDPNASFLDDWWFRNGSDFEEPANPIRWKPIVPPQL